MKFTPRDQAIIKQLKIDPRMSLTKMSRATRIPVTSIYERLKVISQHYNLGIEVTPLHPSDTWIITKKVIYSIEVIAETEAEAIQIVEGIKLIDSGKVVLSEPVTIKKKE